MLADLQNCAVNDRPEEIFAQHLDQKLEDLLARIERCDAYLALASEDSEPALIGSLIKHVLLEVFSYGPHVTEATFTAIGRLPKTRVDLMKAMIHHDLDEVDHGEMALQDFIRLGGDESFARSREMTPASRVMAATCRHLAEQRNPFGYLGYMYPFEALTPILTERAKYFLNRKNFPAEARGFIDFHAEADIGHARALRNLILRVVRDYPGAAPAIDHAFDCFACVYPVPIWDAALQRAEAESW